MTYELKETLLKVESVNKSYDKPILRDINFEVKNIVRPGLTQGQIVSLIGKSGGGKTTLFNIMAGLLKPDSGKVTRLDRSALDLPDTMEPIREGDMGVVFQNSYIYTWRKVRSILRMAIKKNVDIKESDRDDAVEAIIHDLNLEEHASKYSAQLSGGQRQRVAVAEQILNGGDFILFDEPFSGLDTLTIDKVTKILVDVASTDEHKTIVIVSHDLSNCLAISDTAFILASEEGKVGSTITRQIDLAQMGMAWQPDIKDNPAFRDLLKQVKTYL